MTASTRPVSSETGLVFFAVPLLAAVLLFAPLIKGGNRPVPLLLLELAALVLFALMAMQPFKSVWPVFTHHLPKLLLAAIGGVLFLPLVQLIPLPESLWTMLGGRDFYAAALAAIGNESAFRPISLVPAATEAAWLALLPPVAVFLTTVALPGSKLKTLAYLFIGMAVVQAIIGLGQFGTGSVTVFGPLGGLYSNSGIGTYANRDHLAGLLEMALPITLALLMANIQRGAKAPRKHHHKGLRQRISQHLSQYFLHGFKFNRAALLAAAGIAILLGLVFTRSRTGLALGMLSILLCALLFARRIGGERSTSMVSIFSVIGLALAIEIGLAPVLERFTDQSIADDGRWAIFSGTLAGIGEFFPIGSGIGAFPEVYRRFQPGDISMFVNHAHNDYLEWLFEGGLIAAVLILVFLVCYIRRWPQVLKSEHWSHFHFIQLAAGISVLLLGLHGLVDFNLHIPANAIYFAFLAGVFFHREEIAAAETHKAEKPRMPEPQPRPVIDLPPPVSAPNPFAD